jgi:hypothetical protein
MANFKTEVNHLAQNFTSRMHQEYQICKRKTTYIKVQYSHFNTPNEYCQQKTFSLEMERLNPDSSVWKKPKEFKRFYDAVIAAVKKNNPSFYKDLRTISSLNINASHFNEITSNDLD